MRVFVFLSLLVSSCFTPANEPDAASCQGLRWVADVPVPWPSVDCGIIVDPRATPVSGAGGPFQLLVTEYRREGRGCEERPARLLTRRITTEGERLTIGEETTLGDASGDGSIASNGADFAVCSGTSLYTGSGTTELQPACALEASCAGLAYDGEGWGVGWAPGCDAPGELTRTNLGGAPRDDGSVETSAIVVSVASSDDGFGALVGGESLTLLAWPRGTAVPTTYPLGGLSNAIAALSAWPFDPGAWAVFTLQDTTLRMRVLSAAGEVLVDESYEAELAGHQTQAARAASSAAGAAVVISYNSIDGRNSAASRLFVFGAEGALAGQELDVDSMVVNSLTVTDVAMSGTSVLVHKEGQATTVGVTDLVLYDCE